MTSTKQTPRQAAFTAVRVATVAEQVAREAERRDAAWGGTRNSDARDRRREANAAWEAAQAACERAEWAERRAA